MNGDHRNTEQANEQAVPQAAQKAVKDGGETPCIGQDMQECVRRLSVPR
jgi:hypothetical protein